MHRFDGHWWSPDDAPAGIRARRYVSDSGDPSLRVHRQRTRGAFRSAIRTPVRQTHASISASSTCGHARIRVDRLSASPRRLPRARRPSQRTTSWCSAEPRSTHARGDGIPVRTGHSAGARRPSGNPRGSTCTTTFASSAAAATSSGRRNAGGIVAAVSAIDATATSLAIDAATTAGSTKSSTPMQRMRTCSDGSMTRPNSTCSESRYDGRRARATHHRDPAGTRPIIDPTGGWFVDRYSNVRTTAVSRACDR